MGFTAPIVAQAVEVLVRYHGKTTKARLAELVFGSPDRATDLTKDLDWLVDKAKYLHRATENGGVVYWPAREGPSVLNRNDHFSDGTAS